MDDVDLCIRPRLHRQLGSAAILPTARQGVDMHVLLGTHHAGLKRRSDCLNVGGLFSR